MATAIAEELVAEIVARFAAQGVDVLELDVLASNSEARDIYERWGFTPVQLNLGAPIDDARAAPRAAVRPDVRLGARRRRTTWTPSSAP